LLGGTGCARGAAPLRRAGVRGHRLETLWPSFGARTARPRTRRFGAGRELGLRAAPRTLAGQVTKSWRWLRGERRSPASAARRRCDSRAATPMLDRPRPRIVCCWWCPHNGLAVKLPARKCTSHAVWSMTWFEAPPATHIQRPVKAPASFKRRLGSPIMRGTRHDDAQHRATPAVQLSAALVWVDRRCNRANRRGRPRGRLGSQARCSGLHPG
jgi:hypothetical protein